MKGSVVHEVLTCRGYRVDRCKHSVLRDSFWKIRYYRSDRYVPRSTREESAGVKVNRRPWILHRWYSSAREVVSAGHNREQREWPNRNWNCSTVEDANQRNSILADGENGLPSRFWGISRSKSLVVVENSVPIFEIESYHEKQRWRRTSLRLSSLPIGDVIEMLGERGEIRWEVFSFLDGHVENFRQLNLEK